MAKYVSRIARSWYPAPPPPPPPARTAPPTISPTTTAISPISYPVTRRTAYQINVPTIAPPSPSAVAFASRPYFDPPPAPPVNCC
jgi:hypothetical protein